MADSKGNECYLGLIGDSKVTVSDLGLTVDRKGKASYLGLMMDTEINVFYSDPSVGQSCE